MRILHMLGMTFSDAGLIISWIALAAAIFLIWFGWARDLHPGRALVLLLLFALFPGSVYNFALFPTSMALTFVVGSILAASRKRFLIAALLMTMAGVTYPSAWFAAVGLAVGLVVLAISDRAGVIARRTLWGLAGLGAFAVLAIHDQVAFGHAEAYVLVQSHAGVKRLVFPGQPYLHHFDLDVLSLQAFESIFLAIGSAVVAAISWRRSGRDATLLYPACVGVVVILSLFIVDHAGTWNRSVILAAPCVVCLRRLPLPLLCVLVVVVGVTGALISRPFFTNYLV